MSCRLIAVSSGYGFFCPHVFSERGGGPFSVQFSRYYGQPNKNESRTIFKGNEALSPTSRNVILPETRNSSITSVCLSCNFSGQPPRAKINMESIFYANKAMVYDTAIGKTEKRPTSGIQRRGPSFRVTANAFGLFSYFTRALMSLGLGKKRARFLSLGKSSSTAGILQFLLLLEQFFRLVLVKQRSVLSICVARVQAVYCVGVLPLKTEHKTEIYISLLVLYTSLLSLSSSTLYCAKFRLMLLLCTCVPDS